MCVCERERVMVFLCERERLCVCERVRERESGNPDECGSCKTFELMLKRKMVSTSKCFALTRKNRAYHAFAFECVCGCICVCVCVCDCDECVCVCVCVLEIEREKERV